MGEEGLCFTTTSPRLWRGMSTPWLLAGDRRIVGPPGLIDRSAIGVTPRIVKRDIPDIKWLGRGAPEGEWREDRARAQHRHCHGPGGGDDRLVRWSGGSGAVRQFLERLRQQHTLLYRSRRSRCCLWALRRSRRTIGS